MCATNWEFANRASIFGMIIGVGFATYTFDRQNVVASLANRFAVTLRADADSIARILFAAAALLLVAGAIVRTWASSYLSASVVYAAEVKSDSLVADGPYRWVRNPLYFANLLLAAGMGAVMSRIGFLFAVLAIPVFCYRLILREEEELQASRGSQYEAYRRRVPRLWPALRPGIASSNRRPSWADGFRAETWYWGFAAAVIAFALTLDMRPFLVLVGLGVVLLWLPASHRRKPGSNSR